MLEFKFYDNILSDWNGFGFFFFIERYAMYLSTHASTLQCVVDVLLDDQINDTIVMVNTLEKLSH